VWRQELTGDRRIFHKIRGINLTVLMSGREWKVGTDAFCFQTGGDGTRERLSYATGRKNESEGGGADIITFPKERAEPIHRSVTY